MYKKMAIHCVAIIMLFYGYAIFANEMLQQKIITFEQSIPWLDVYDGSKKRQHSWHQDVMKGNSPQELGRFLVDLQGFIINEKLGNDWDGDKHAWIIKANNATTYNDIAESLKQLQEYYFNSARQEGGDIKKDIITFEQYVHWEDVKDGFKTR